MTLGNVVVYGAGEAPGYPNYFGLPVGTEEFKHTLQGQVLGPLYLPSHIIGGIVSIFSNPRAGLEGVDIWHRNNFMETGPMQGRVW
jgi:hypothetical protein